MADLRVDPAEVGPRLAAALSAAAAALAAPAGIAPPLPPGADPVSVAAANRVAVESAKLSGHLAGGISRLIEGAQAVTTALTGYVVTDAAGAAGIIGSSAAGASAAIPAINIPSPPVVDIPNVPVDIPAALATVPADPATVDDALTAGAGQGALEGHAAAWDGMAAQLHNVASELATLGSNPPGSWDGPAAQNLSQRLLEFGDWMHTSGDSATTHADGTRQVGGLYQDAVNLHPRSADVRNTQQALLNAASRAAAGDPVAAAQAAGEEAKLAKMKEQSAMVMTRYGQGASGIKDVPHPGDSPRIGGDGDPHLPNKPAKDLGSVDDPQSGDSPAQQLGETTGQSVQEVMSTLTEVPSQVANAVGQALGKAGQSLGQVGQQAGQAASQLGQVLGGGSPLSGPGKSSTGNPLSGPGSGSDPLADSGLGSGDGGAGGGGAGGTMPAALPEQLSPATQAAPPPQSPAPPSAVPRTSAPPVSGMGGTPMGMMPMGRHGGESDKELPRNPEWFPDEPLVKDEPEVSDAVAGQHRRPRPTET